MCIVTENSYTHTYIYIYTYTYTIDMGTAVSMPISGPRETCRGCSLLCETHLCYRFADLIQIFLAGFVDVGGVVVISPVSW